MQVASLFCCLLLVVTSQGHNPAMRHLLGKSENNSTTGADCAADNPLEFCANIISNYTGDSDKNVKCQTKTRAKFLDFTMELMSGISKFESIKPDLCTATTKYKDCVDKIIADCGIEVKLVKKKHRKGDRKDKKGGGKNQGKGHGKRKGKKVRKHLRSVLLLSKFLHEDVCKKSDLEQTLNSINFTSCYTSMTVPVAEVLKKVKRFFEKLEKIGDCNSAARIDTRLLRVYKSFEKDCREKMNALIHVLVRLFVRPHRRCNAKKFNNHRERGNPKSKKRVGGQLVSLNHYRHNIKHARTSPKVYVTCEDEKEHRNVSMFEWDYISVQCELSPANDSGIVNTQCHLACITIRDSEFNEVDKVCLSSDKTFEKKGRTIKKGKKKKGGKLEGDVKIVAAGANKIKVKDWNTRTMIVLRRVSYKPKTGNKKYMLFINVRASQSILDNSSGRLVKPCDEEKNITVSAASRRRRRAAGSAISNYDVASTGDKAAGSYAALADEDASAAETEDGALTASRLLLALPLLSLPILVTGLAI